MPIFNWRNVPSIDIPAGPVAAPWKLACDTLGDGTHIKIEATGIWQLGGDALGQCGPDGLAGTPKPEARGLILADCPIGALLGKIGGSSALFSAVEKPNSASAALTEGQPFPIGASLIAALPAKTLGRLYVGFNDLLRPVIVLVPVRLVISVATPTF